MNRCVYHDGAYYLILGGDLFKVEQSRYGGAMVTLVEHDCVAVYVEDGQLLSVRGRVAVVIQ